MSKIFVVIAIAATIFLTMATSAAADVSDGNVIFQANCAGCHVNGGNIIRRGKNLKQKALQRNKMDDLSAIVSLVTKGKNNMPAYEDRLSSQEIETVAAYVLERAKQGWH